MNRQVVDKIARGYIIPRIFVPFDIETHLLLAGEGDFNMKTTLSHDQNKNKNYNYHKNNEQCIIIISTEQTAGAGA